MVDALEGSGADALEVLREANVAVDEIDPVRDVLDQPHRPGRDQVVDDHHLMTALDQRAHEIRADEPRPAGDEHAPRRLSGIRKR